MIQLLKDVTVDWLARRRIFIFISVALLLAGLASAVGRQLTPGGTDAFNLGVDFKGGTVVTVRFKQRPSDDAIRSALSQNNLGDSIVQSTDRADEVLIKVAQQGTSGAPQDAAQVDAGRSRVASVLANLGPQAGAEIVGTEAVGAVAGVALRNQAVTATLLALVGILVYISMRFEWTYGAAAVIAVFHDVLVTLGFFSIFQWEVSLTVIAALLTLVGFSVNDTIVTFDRIRENLRLNRRESLYKIANDAVNQTLSRTVITAGLVFLSVLALVLFGGEVLRGFSLALFVGVIVGTYSTIAIAAPIMVWWQQRVEAGNAAGRTLPAKATPTSRRVTTTRSNVAPRNRPSATRS